MEVSTETPVKKTKRLTSVVWNHFERVRKADICYAVCLHCKKKLSGSSNSGTTHLRNHLIRCLKRSNFDVSQILTAKRKRKDTTVTLANVNYDEGQIAQIKEETIVPVTYKFEHEQKNEMINLGSMKFDQERSRMDLARMIMLHGYPLSMVEDVGFKLFMKNLQPAFEVMNNGAIELDCMAIYEKEKQKVFELIFNLPGKVTLAVGMWASPENVEYLCLTANYIDEDWVLQKKILNFITLDSSNTHDMLSDVIIRVLEDWDIAEKLFSMTFDDYITNEDIIFRIKDSFNQRKPLLKNGELFDVRCATHILKSMVQVTVEALRDVTYKIRESVRYVTSSQTKQFSELSQQVGITNERRLFLDYPMRWNSTCLMLETAVEHRAAFSLLQEHDSAYTMALSEREWEWASSFTAYMKLFVEVTNVFTDNKLLTANIYFPEICDVHIQLIEWCKNPDDFINSTAMKMKTMFDNYWSKCSLTLAIAAILDPRFKMKLVEYYYPQIYNTDAPDRVKEVYDGIRDLFNEYSLRSTSFDQVSGRLACSLPSTSNGSRDRLRGFDKFLHETSQNQSVISDLEKYLEEPVFPRNCDFNILNWWKVHTPRYPILSMMARDILGIPISTLSPDLAFSTAGRVLDHHRSSLNPDIRQALICGQDWLQMESEDTNPYSMHSPLSIFIDTN
ncbi:hypothetical protein LguiB_002786 [Lonicera macranthoides]